MTDAVLTKIDKQYTWNAESVFATRADWFTARDKLTAELPSLAPYKGHLHEGPAALADAMDSTVALLRQLMKLYVYASFAAAVDVKDEQVQGMEAQARGLYGQFIAAQSFIDPELIAIGKDTLTEWVKHEPRLGYLEHYIDDLFRKQEHVRSAEVEEILGMAIEPLGAVDNVASMLTDNDMQFADYKTITGEAVKLYQSNLEATKWLPDREARKSAWENYADEYLAHRNTLAANLAVAVKSNVFFARAHRYDTALEAALSQDNIPKEVYYNLVETFKRNLPVWHKYWAVRKKALKVDTLHPYDIWGPISSKSPKVEYKQAIDYILEGMAPLGSEYGAILKKALTEDRWVDVYPSPNKRQGAFSTGSKGTLPFIFVSYSDEIESMSTLAHELGHSMHSYFTNREQPDVYTNYSMFAAETASNFNQALVRASLLATNTDRDFQIAVIEEAMSNFHRYFFIMPTLSRFELEFHTRIERGETPTADQLNNLMADLFAEGYGGHMQIDRARVGITWAQFPHLYARFYVLNYTAGISAANALARGILDGTSGAVDNYLTFLKTGSSVYPVEALRRAGADMATPDPIDKAFSILAGLVDRLEALTN